MEAFAGTGAMNHGPGLKDMWTRRHLIRTLSYFFPVSPEAFGWPFWVALLPCCPLLGTSLLPLG